MYRVACLFLACASSAACADNVKTLVIQGVATGPASLIVTSAPVECSTPLGPDRTLACVRSIRGCCARYKGCFDRTDGALGGHQLWH